MSALHLFEGFGVELEYMIVDRDTLDVRPVCDRIIHRVAGAYESEIERGRLAWSNELVLHVIELKTNGPADSLGGLAVAFQRDIRGINALAAELGARLMPTGVHPWMDPHAEMRLWPHEYSPIYDAFNRIFDCRGHGWANLQATHLNLPFGDDAEFARLHAALRLLLPVLPGLAAGTPILGARCTGLADARLDVYRHNADRIPSVMGDVIPEPVFTKADYERDILERIYRDIAPLDPEGILQHEWLNARGAIARFDRQTIEIRVLDVQECPQADLAILALIVAALKALCDEKWCGHRDQAAWDVAPLVAIFDAAVRDGDRAVVENADYLRLFGRSPEPCTVGDLWRRLADSLSADMEAADAAPLEVIFSRGCLARRIQKAIGDDCSRPHLAAVYADLCDCLSGGRMFDPDGR